MRIRLGELRRIIREAYVSGPLPPPPRKPTREESAEAPDDAPMGAIAFGSQRWDVAFERNTVLEDRVERALMSYVRGNVQLPEVVVGQLRDFMASGLYGKTLVVPDVSVVYRGMTYSEEELRRALGLGPGDPLGDVGEELVSCVVDVRKTTGSWTKKLSQAEHHSKGRFGTAEVRAKPYNVVFSADVAENGVFLDLRKVYEIDPLRRYMPEGEVLALGPVVARGVRWSKKN